MAIDDGGAAFPFVAEGYQPEAGLSIRDYFAANCPTEPQWDFDVKMPSPRPKPEFPCPGRGGHALNDDEVRAWDVERAKQRFIQWPWVWADAMLAQRRDGAK
jgi:hypothetical protein